MNVIKTLPLLILCAALPCLQATAPSLFGRAALAQLTPINQRGRAPIGPVPRPPQPVNTGIRNINTRNVTRQPTPSTGGFKLPSERRDENKGETRKEGEKKGPATIGSGGKGRGETEGEAKGGGKSSAPAIKRIESKYVPPEIKFPPGAVSTNLFFEPVDMIVQPGETFEIWTVLNNRSRKAVDGFEFTVLYNADWLHLLDYDASNLAEFVKTQPGEEKSTDRLHADDLDGFSLKHFEGRLVFSADFKTPMAQERRRLVKLKFRAADSPGATKLRFASPPQGVAAVYSENQNILGKRNLGLDGLLSSNLFIREPQPVDSLTSPSGLNLATATPDEMPGAENGAPALTAASSKAKLDAEASIVLQPPTDRGLEPEEEFWVDLVLLNDSAAPIQSLGALVLFDPDRLEVIDVDEDNYIFRGVNIWDGGFHKTYPFDVHRANSADNERGIIEYKVGRHQDAKVLPSGVFARIRFRALEPGGVATVRLARELRDSEPQTYVRAYGVDRMADAWEDSPQPPQLRFFIEPKYEMTESSTAQAQ